MPSETVKVMVRVRPFNEREKGKGFSNIISTDTKLMQISLTNPNSTETEKVFSYDTVFSPDTQQQTIYEKAAFQLVESVLEGYNGTIFAYGQTGCGKTYTMMGAPENDSLKGIIPRAFAHIFGNIESSTQKNFLIRCSYIEIYNEEVHDLIGTDVKAKLELKESSDKGVHIKNLSMHIVKSIADIERLMVLGLKNRSVGETLMNKDSSRSHSVFTIYIESAQTDAKGNQNITLGKLNLVDLAGSERQSKTHATGDRLKEANKINLSLSALGNVISALVDGKSSHIPYRDSKLTRLLQDSLGGNTKTVMIANVSAASDSYDETLGTLRYASRAKNIKNQPKVNQDPKDALLFEYAEEIKRLKAQLENAVSITQTTLTEEEMYFTAKRRKLRNTESEYEEKIKQKNDEIQNERKRREELEARLSSMQSQLVIGGAAGDNKSSSSGEPEEKKQYQEMLKKMQEHQQEHENLLQEKQKREEEVAVAEKKYASLQEEVEAQRRIISTLKKKYKEATNEIKDLEREHELNKEEMLDTIRVLEKENQINRAIMAYMVSPSEYDKLRGAARWRDDRNEYVVPPFVVRAKQVKFPKISNAKGLEMITEEWRNRDIEFQDEYEYTERESHFDHSIINQRSRRESNVYDETSSKVFERTANGAQTNFFKKARHNTSLEKHDSMLTESKPSRKPTPSQAPSKSSLESQFNSVKDSVNMALQSVYKIPPRVPVDFLPKKKHPYRNVTLEPINMNQALRNATAGNSIGSISQERRELNDSSLGMTQNYSNNRSAYKRLATIEGN